MTSDHTAFGPQSATANDTESTTEPTATPAAPPATEAPAPHLGTQPGNLPTGVTYTYESMFLMGIAGAALNGYLLQRQSTSMPSDDIHSEHALQPALFESGQISDDEYVDALLSESSLGEPGVVEISRRTTEDDAAEIMCRLRERSNPSPRALPEPAPEYAFENWVDQSRQLPNALMNVGNSYARQQFNHRAELCFRAAMKAGHPEAEAALAALPRDENGIVLAGQDRPLEDTDTASDTLIAPIDQQTMSFMEEGLRWARSGSPGRARLAWSIGWALDMKAV